SVGLSEVSVILAAIIWAWMWGPIGLVLATPLSVCLVVLGKYVPGLKIFDQLLGERPPVRDSVRLYQRLLSRNEDDADDLLEEYLEEHSLLSACDELMLPTLEMMHTDHVRGYFSDSDGK